MEILKALYSKNYKLTKYDIPSLKSNERLDLTIIKHFNVGTISGRNVEVPIEQVVNHKAQPINY